MAAKNALDKRRCNSSEDETQYSSRDYGDNNEGDNTLLDTRSVSSSSSEGYGGYVNSGLQSDEDSETGNMDVTQIVETVLRQPVSPSLRISESSDVHVGPSLTYNGPVTINVTVQPQSEHQATPPQSDPQLECQLELRNQTQPQLQTEHPPEQQPISHAQIQSQTQIQHPPQQQPVSQLQTQNEIREPPRQQPLSQTLDEPSPLTQQPRLEQPQTMVQRSLQTYRQVSRSVKPAGCQLIAEELTRKDQCIELEAGDVGADVVDTCCEQNVSFVALLIIMVMVFAIGLTLVIGYRHNAQNATPSPDVRVTQSMAKGVSLNLKENTENEHDIKPGRSQEPGQKVKNKKEKRCEDTKDCSSLPSKNDELPKSPYKPQNSSEEQISGPCQHTLGTSTDSLPSRASFGHTKRTSIATTTACSCIQPRNKRSSGT
ncbi:uncharacterized protein LOC126188279 isoform X1 [Schistocerca cancellata]|uniref:uncharacterized protein LOC126188279 isoform X1 n=1 Tax=Schistocerca cancellata TaxID=274614 RepID=UPI00211896EE|nr:uncharacterized protein LOC126188279 isoform X1 [Schistocerca cancellata]